jgi:hypothetical protein
MSLLCFSLTTAAKHVASCVRLVLHCAVGVGSHLAGEETGLYLSLQAITPIHVYQKDRVILCFCEEPASYDIDSCHAVFAMVQLCQ